jgi:hypothetical protein
VQRIAGGFGVAILLMITGIAVAQNPAADTQAPGAQMSVPNGYAVHSSVDLGGRIADIAGSGAMYDTLVNLQSGPRVLGQTFQMRALPGNMHPLFDNLTTFSSGYGGEPYAFTKMDVDKGKFYEFSGLFRRDRQYADYDLIGNPNIVSGYSIPISGSTTPYAWPQVMDSPFLFNTVRRMTDTNLTLLPQSKVTFRFAYSQNIFQGPSRTPSGDGVGGSEVILQEYQRNSTDDFTAAVDWKPVQGTRLTYEEEINHSKINSYFTMDPAYFTVQEADGTKVALDASYQTQSPYGYSSSTGAFTPSGVCNATSMLNTHTILYANPAGGLPIIDPACNVISSYLRQQPTREIFPTEIFRLQSSSIKNISMNGNLRYTSANMNLPNYYEIFQGLQKAAPTANRELATSGSANAKREVMAFDYGIVWQASKTVAIEDQLNFSNAHQPGSANFTGGTTVADVTSTSSTPNCAAPNVTINCTVLTTTTATSGAGPGAPGEGGPSIGKPAFGYFGQRFVTNNFTVSWDATSRTTFSLTYRHGNHVITEGANISAPVQNGVCPATNSQPAFCGTVTINEDGGIFNAALRPASNWDLNGTVELIYDDNVFTPVAPRQTQHYRIHTLYRPTPWATISGAYNDLERHNNTNNTGAVSFAADGVTPLALSHVDHSRVLSLGADLMPNEHYGFDFNYAYSDVYTSTNTCFQAAATVQPALPLPGGGFGPTTVVPGAAFETTPGTPTAGLCGLVPVESGHGVALFLGPVRDFADAPTQYVSAAVNLSPNPKFRSDIGYRVSDVNGSRLFSQAQDVNGTLVSNYQSPFVSAKWTVHPGFTWKAEYDYYGYGEGGQSGAQYCNNNATITTSYAGATIPVVPCSSVANTAMSPGTPVYGFTAPRNFHANNITLGFHYEF